uniref:Uncharacterized protein n=1 Tax=Oryza meridionalis TaxID=40149 RepID=A0A0E0EGB9_9ORYZ
MQEPNEAPTPVSYPRSPSPSMFPSTRRVILSSQGTTHERQIREFHYCSGSISIPQSIDRRLAVAVDVAVSRSRSLSEKVESEFLRWPHLARSCTFLRQFLDN